MRRVLVLGAGGGIGGALVTALAENSDVERVFAASRQAQPQPLRAKVDWIAADCADERALAGLAARLGDQPPLDMILNATGVLHAGEVIQPEKSWRMMEAEAMAQVLRINLIGPALAAKHLLPLLRKDDRAVFAAISARVGSISDNRLGGWYSYRASKAALNMLLRTLSIELARTHPQAIVAGLHPGTVDSALSKPFQRGVSPEQLFTPERSATAMLKVLDSLSATDSGHIFAWDGARIPA